MNNVMYTIYTYAIYIYDIDVQVDIYLQIRNKTFSLVAKNP